LLTTWINVPSIQICHLHLGNGNMNGMKDTVQIDQAGRLVLPKRLRDSFRLKTGDTLAIGVKGDAIELRPTKPGFRLERINGVLVLAGDTSLPARDWVAEAREERMDELARKGSR
jgi:AbrB family looped-hinge helix DNA binding protein